MESGVRAIDFMNTKVVTTLPSVTIMAAAKVMNRYRIGGLPVCDKAGKLVGILTERDIMMKVIAKNKQPGRVRVKSIMVSPPRVVGRKFDDMSKLAKKMKKFDVTRIPIVDKGKIIGLVTNKDILEQAPDLIDVILEQAKIKEPNAQMPTAFGKCEGCGSNGHLLFKENKFMCEFCL